jgi:hypothetical protein
MLSLLVIVHVALFFYAFLLAQHVDRLRGFHSTIRTVVNLTIASLPILNILMLVNQITLALLYKVTEE